MPLSSQQRGGPWLMRVVVAIVAVVAVAGSLALTQLACGVDLIGGAEAEDAALGDDAGAPGDPDSTTTGDGGCCLPMQDGGGDGQVIVPPVDAGPYGTRIRTDLIALYEMEEGAGATLQDTSGFGTPLPLTFVSATDIVWTKGAVSVTNDNRAHSTVAATKIITACTGTSQITIEAWITSGASLLTSYARLVTLATTAEDYNVAMTTTNTQLAFGLLAGGVRAYTYANITSGLRHLVYTFNAGTKNIYVDGVLASSGMQSGTFASWNATHPLTLFRTALLDRPTFPHEIHLVAIYSRALTTAEIAVNLAAGPDP